MTFADVEQKLADAGFTHDQIAEFEDNYVSQTGDSNPDDFWAVLVAQYPQLGAGPVATPDNTVSSQAQTIGNAQFYTIKAIEAYQAANATAGAAFLQKAKTWVNALDPAVYDFSGDDPKA